MHDMATGVTVAMHQAVSCTRCPLGLTAAMPPLLHLHAALTVSALLPTGGCVSVSPRLRHASTSAEAMIAMCVPGMLPPHAPPADANGWAGGGGYLADGTASARPAAADEDDSLIR